MRPVSLLYPVTSLKIDYNSSNEIVSTGLPGLDKLLGKGGMYVGSSTLITGSAGTSKTTLAAYFALSSCKRNERVLYFSFEEALSQIVRNMKSIGINLQPHIKSNLLHIHASRPALQGLEMHLLELHKLMGELKPRTVIVDPISSLITIGSVSEVRGMLIRLLDLFKKNQVNTVFTALTHENRNLFHDLTVDAVSSLADNWINVKNSNIDGDRERSLLIIKARGMGHANNHQQFRITNKGIKFKNKEEE